MSIFQRAIENVLKDLPGRCVRIDNILISGKSDEIHLENLLHRVLKRLRTVVLSSALIIFFSCWIKLSILVPPFLLLGFHLLLRKCKDASPPSNVSELQSFLGSANFLCKFVPDFSKLAPPLYGRLRKEVPWRWSKLEQDAFDDIKAALCSDSVLRHYDPMAELILQCDASSVGVGAALLQPRPDGALQPVAYASRILNNVEQNYSQIERESLDVFFGVTKFRQYLLGRHFKLLADHKPLITLLGEHKPVRQLAAARIKRWALLLAAYDYTIEFTRGKDNVFADFLSRKPIKYEQSAAEQVTVTVIFIEEDQFLNASVVAMEAIRDPVLGKVLQFTQQGWPG